MTMVTKPLLREGRGGTARIRRASMAFSLNPRSLLPCISGFDVLMTCNVALNGRASLRQRLRRTDVLANVRTNI